MKTKIIIKAFYLIIFICLFIGCKETIESIIEGQEISGKATITKSENNFTLVTDEGFQYVPTNLSDEFKVDKLRIEFKGIVQKNPNQYGIDKIQITYIKKLS